MLQKFSTHPDIYIRRYPDRINICNATNQYAEVFICMPKKLAVSGWCWRSINPQDYYSIRSGSKRNQEIWEAGAADIRVILLHPGRLAETDDDYWQRFGFMDDFADSFRRAFWFVQEMER